MLVKAPNVEVLSKEVNFEMKYNLKKMPIASKGIYSF